MAKRKIMFLLTCTLAIALAFACVSSLAAYAEEPGFTERAVRLITDGKEAGEIRLLFCDATPNLAYLGMNQAAALLGRPGFTVRASGDGRYELESWNGARLVCEAKEGRILVPDWNAFFALPMPLEDRALGLKDTSAHFSRVTDVSYEGEAAPVTIDFAAYGIRLYCDEGDLYLPVSTMSNLMTDIAVNFFLYNGEAFYEQRISLGDDPSAGFFASDTMQALIHGEDRPEDLIRQSYADLCLCFDFFYGYPEKLAFEEALAEKGFDQALEGLGEDGKALKAGLLSPSFAEHAKAAAALFFGHLSDGHTIPLGLGDIFYDPALIADSAFPEDVMTSYMESVLNDPVAAGQLLDQLLIPQQRSRLWGEDSYREYGSTAIIRLDSFLPDEAAWDSYYHAGGAFPQDCVGIVATGLKRASENPEIENVIFDLSCNSGGSSDALAVILALTTGQNQLRGKNMITGQAMTVSFEADANFDGVYDERDREARYDFHYGALMSRHAFSCGNLFPFLLQEAGAVLIGEPSSGGTCSIQVGSDAEGLYYVMSSGQWKLVDAQGASLERGCSIDVPIKTGTKPLAELIPEAADASMVDILLSLVKEVPLYDDYYDDARLDTIMNDWFAAQAQLAPAA